MNGPIVDISDLRFSWPGQSQFSLEIGRLQLAAGEHVLLLGDSGSGKSTLLSLICATLAPDHGQIRVAGADLSKLSGRACDRFRAEKIGVIFQQFNLLPFGTVMDNILLPLQFAPQRRQRLADPKGAARALCERLHLLPALLDQPASRLSVGQQQRVAVARALIGNPPLIIADEPTSALDATSQAAFLESLFSQTDQGSSGSSKNLSQKATVLMVSHDARLAAHFDRVLKMEEIAKVTQGGPVGADMTATKSRAAL